MKTYNILSYGGGVCSSAMFFHLVENDHQLDLVIFSDTGDTKESTYSTIKQMFSECLKRNIEFVVVKSKHGQIFDYYKKNKALPSIMRKDCSAKFKIRVVNNYLRKRFGKKARFNIYIGFTLEEATRMKKSEVKYKTNHFPLVKARITRNDAKKILKDNNFTAEKSACVGCIYNKKHEWINLLKKDPARFEYYNSVEKSCSRYPELSFNGTYTLEELKHTWKNQKSLKQFIDQEPSCDVVAGCFL